MSKKLTITYPTTGLLQRTLSKVSPNSAVRVILEVIFLLALGIVATILHAKLKIPMQLPGRQGMVFMAFLIVGRLSSNIGPASLITSLSSSALLMSGAFSFGDPFTPIIYPVLGFMLDLFYRFTANKKRSILLISLLAGICWMVIPSCRLIISLFTAYPFHSFRYGPVIPFISHLVFGFTGGVLGYSVTKVLKTSSNR